MARVAPFEADAPMIVLHADWGKDPRKRWIARAVGARGGWRVASVGPWGAEGPPLARLGLRPADEGPALVGVDFPIGLPRAFADLIGVASFTDLLPRLGGPGWERFYDVACTRNEISSHRPFYPDRPGGARREHLATALDLPFDALSRVCDRPTADRPAASPLFWTLGPKQAGKAAIAGWTELVVPLRRDENAALWPFDGRLADLVATRGVTIAETYPADSYAPLGFGRGWSKRRQADRAARGQRLLDGLARVGATVAPEVFACICNGFTSQVSGEDAFDAVVGLAGMLAALEAGAAEPADPVVRAVEGAMLVPSSPLSPLRGG